MTLVLPGERPADTLARLDRTPGRDYLALTETEEYQRVREAAIAESEMARKVTRRVERKGRA